MKYCLFIVVCFLTPFLYSQTKKNTDSVSYYNKLANSNINKNKYNQAVFYTKKSIDFCQNNNKSQDLANQTFKLGKLYYNQQKYDAALKNFHKSVSLFDKVKPTCTKILALHYIGATNTAQGNFEIGNIYYKKADSLLKQLKIVDHAEVLNYQKAMALKIGKDLPLAAKTFQKIVKKPDNAKIIKTKADSYYQLGLIETKLKRNDSALVYFDKGLDYSAKNNNLNQKSKIILAISQYYKKNRNFDLAES